MSRKNKINKDEVIDSSIANEYNQVLELSMVPIEENSQYAHIVFLGNKKIHGKWYTTDKEYVIERAILRSFVEGADYVTIG